MLAAARPMRLSSVSRRFMSTYKNLLTEERGGVALITLNRPKALNALTPELITELVDATAAYDANPAIGAMVITGSGSKAFAAGADIMTMKDKSYMEAAGYVSAYGTKMYGDFDKIGEVRKPIIAAVNGFALGGGCELGAPPVCPFPPCRPRAPAWPGQGHATNAVSDALPVCSPRGQR